MFCMYLLSYLLSEGFFLSFGKSWPPLIPPNIAQNYVSNQYHLFSLFFS